MKIKTILLGAFETNCYLIYGAEPDGCLVIDPADDGARILALCDQLSCVPKAVLLTHGHYDHLLAIPALQARYPALPVYCHPLDIPQEKVEYDMGYAFPTVAAFANVLPLSDGQRLALAGESVLVMHTPGHTPGSVTFLIGSALFTGDTLFCGSIGRTDFAGGSDADMALSIRRLKALPGDYAVYGGHGISTTLNAERKRNPYLNGAFTL